MPSRSNRRVKLNNKDIFYVDLLHSMIGEGIRVDINAGEIALNSLSGDYVTIPYEKNTLSDRLFELVKVVFINNIRSTDPEDAAAIDYGAKNLVILKVDDTYHFRIVNARCAAS
jgi:hypothetical protein